MMQLHHNRQGWLWDSDAVPKRVDHDERRRQIIDGVWRIAAGRGLGAVTLREVAAEAGVSMRLVQYYFRSKENLLLASLERLGASGSARIAAQIGMADPSPRDVVHGCLIAALPVDEDSRRQALVAHAFAAAALTDPQLAAATRRYPDQLQQVIANQIRQVRQEFDADAEARGLLAMVSGLTLSTLLGEIADQDAVAVVDYHLDRVFGARQGTPTTRPRR
jgi:TetR/AcrR family transcriptional regulator, transcriptional repressor of bet genes